MLYICTKFCRNIFDGFKAIGQTSFYTKTVKGQNSEDGDTIFILCTLFDSALYLCIIS